MPRLWPGETVAVLGTGPSMSREAADKVRGRCRVIAVNDAYRLAPWADMLYAADARWWTAHPAATAFAGMKVSIAEGGWDPKVRVPGGLRFVCSGGMAGFDTRRDRVRTGRNSAYQAAHVAAHLGAARVLLMGCDMQGDHFFGEHPRAIRRATKFDLLVDLFRSGAPEFKAHGVELVNCTPRGRLTFLPTMDVDEALAQ